MQRTSPSSVLFTSYNLLNLAAGDAPEDRGHYETVTGVIRALGTDVLAVQEIVAADGDTAARCLRQLADDTGLRCEVPGPGGGRSTALAVGGHGYSVGLMWRDGIEPVPGSLRYYGGRDFWHGLAIVTLDVGGTLIRHAAFHATPFGRGLRADQNERVVAAVTRPEGEPPALVGADWNTECADRVEADGTWELYEPADPYAGVDWFADLIYQCQWDYDEHGRRRHWADRRPGDVLWSGGLHDAAALVGADWQPTAGHHPDDVYGAHGIRRRIDAIRVTAPLAAAMRGHEVADTPQARSASDHLPVTVEYLPMAAHALIGGYARARPDRTEEFRKQGPCRFDRPAVVEGCITGVEPGSAKEGRAGISRQSCWPVDAPAPDDVPRGIVAAVGPRPCGGSAGP